MKVLYFGCKSKDEKGHFCWLYPNLTTTYRDRIEATSVLPFRADILDGGLLKNAYSPQSKAILSRIGNWTIISMGDYSADGRGASNASFVAEGNHTLLEMIAIAHKYFPEQAKRIEAAAPITAL